MVKIQLFCSDEPPGCKAAAGVAMVTDSAGGLWWGSSSKAPTEGGTMQGTCEPQAAPHTGVQGDCGSWEASGWERLVRLVLKLINHCGAL